jgi:hypothetical protein
MVQDDDDADDETVPLHHDEIAKNRLQPTPFIIIKHELCPCLQ